MGRHRVIKIPMSPIIRGQRIFASPENSTMNHMVGLTKQTVSVPHASPSPIDHKGLASVPVTPDPNSSSKSIVRAKSNGRSSTVAKAKKSNKDRGGRSHSRLNKFVTRLHDMLVREMHSGIVMWRRGLLVLFCTDAFSKRILPKYFNTRNFKTFRRQLNYYGFAHVRSFSATGNTTTALWINQELAEDEINDDVSAVLKLRRVEPNEVANTIEGRRLRKELAIHTVEEDIGLNSKMLELDQIRSMAVRGEDEHSTSRGQQCAATPEFLSPRPADKQHTISSTSSFPSILQVDSENSMNSSSGATNYSSNDDTSSGGESSGFAPSMPKTRDEAANTDAAASVLLMLSRS